jgi:putative Holliday junction resolvase
MLLTRALGIDYGTARIGLALSDPMQIVASPLCVIENKGLNKTLTEIGEIIKQNNVSVVAVGIALHMDGADSELSKLSKSFGGEIAKTGIPVKFVDERFTTKIATRALYESFGSNSRRFSRFSPNGNHSKGKIKNRVTKTVDKISASIILQTYLDTK